MTCTLPFTDLGKHDAGSAGGKGASLGEMTKVGIPVPPGFVVLAGAFEHFLKETDLVQEIDAILKTVDAHAIHTVEKASADIQALILRAQMPRDIAREILEGFRGLDTPYVAVRSSATAEDGAEHAWAGQLDSFLNTTEETLIQNVQRCWASLFTPRAILYRFEKGLDSTHISVAVVVQTMINSETSGIAFSVHPVTEDPDQMIIEAGFGLGEAIVSGQVTPDSYVVSKSKHICIDINVNDQGRALYHNEGGGNTWKDLGEKGREQVLTETQILELATLVKKIEEHYGFPCDIEWCFENGQFYIVQSRPITTLSQTFGDVDNSHAAEDVSSEIFNSHLWHYMGRWKQQPLPCSFWTCHMHSSIFQNLLKEHASSPVFEVDGYFYRRGENKSAVEESIEMQYRDNSLEQLVKEIEAAGEDIRTSFEVYTQNKKHDITDAILLYKHMMGLWYATTLLGDSLLPVAKSIRLIKTESEFIDMVYPYLRPTWIEQEEWGVFSIAEYIRKNSEVKTCTLDTLLDLERTDTVLRALLNEHHSLYYWVGISKWEGNPHSNTYMRYTFV